MKFQISPQDKKIILLLLLIFFVILVIVFFEFANKMQVLYNTDFSSDISSELSSEISDFSNKLSSITKDENISNVRKNLKEIFNLMNSRNYESLYYLISDDFKEEEFNNSFEDFVTYMDEVYLKGKYYFPKFNSYKRYQNTYIVTVALLPYDPETSNILSSTSSKRDIFTINLLDDNNYSLSFNHFVGRSNLNKTLTKGDITVTLNKVLLYQKRCEFTMKFENAGDEFVVVPNEAIYCYTGSRPNFYSSSFIIPPKDSTEIRFQVNTGLSIPPALPKVITIYKIKVNDKSYSFGLPLTYCVDV